MEKKRFRFALVALVATMTLSLIPLAGCGEASQESNNVGAVVNQEDVTGAENGDGDNSSSIEIVEATVVESLFISNVEFALWALVLEPDLVPGNIPAGNTPFMITLSLSSEGNIEAAITDLSEHGLLLVNGTNTKIYDVVVTTTEDYALLLASTPDDLNAPGLSIEIMYGNEKLVVA